MRLRIAILLLAGWSQVCATTPLHGNEGAIDPTVQKDQVASAIDAAEAARLGAAAAGAEWLNTESLIQQAREALEDGQWQQAMSLAEKAERQGLLAVEQARREADAWRERVVR